MEILIGTPPGTHHIGDAQQAVADGVQLRHVLDLEADGKDAPAAGQVLAVEFFYPDTGGGHSGGEVQQQAVPGNAVQLQRGLEGLLLGIGPADPDPAGGFPGVIPVGGVGAVGPVDGYAEALGDEAHDGVPPARGCSIWRT